MRGFVAERAVETQGELELNFCCPPLNRYSWQSIRDFVSRDPSLFRKKIV